MRVSEIKEGPSGEPAVVMLRGVDDPRGGIDLNLDTTDDDAHA